MDLLDGDAVIIFLPGGPRHLIDLQCGIRHEHRHLGRLGKRGLERDVFT
ncbi:hypothetical protein ACTJLD_11005 [Burkholderia sp. 22088]